MGIVGPLASIIEFFGAWFIGDLADRGILLVDLTLDSIKIAMSEKQWKDAAKKAYDKATAKVYTEDEKQKIREQYLDALRGFARVGRLRDNNNP